VAACQEVVQNEISNVTTESMTARQVVAEMRPRENAAQRRFLRSRREARERALDAREHFRRHVEVKTASLKDPTSTSGQRPVRKYNTPRT